MIRLIASDLDGTLLLNGAQTLPPEIFPLIRGLREKGILFAAASGRQYANLRRLFAPALSEMAFICENGALLVQDGKVLYQDAFDRELVLDILREVLRKKDAEFTCSARDFYYLMPKTAEYRNMIEKEVKCDCRLVRSLDEITEPCMKAAVFEKEGITDETLRYWQERFSDRCKVVTSGYAWVDFIPYTTNKAKGVRKIQELYGISDEECMAFGDEYNDLEMLQAVKYGFAMNHSRPGVRAVAPYQTDRVEPVLEKLLSAGGDIGEVLREIRVASNR